MYHFCKNENILWVLSGIAVWEMSVRTLKSTFFKKRKEFLKHVSLFGTMNCIFVSLLREQKGQCTIYL